MFTDNALIDIYADDTTLHAADKNYKTVENILQTGATGFHKWCVSNKMHINMAKTTQMTVGTRQNLAKSHSFEIYIETEIIQTLCHQKLLGVIIRRPDTELGQTDRCSLRKYLKKIYSVKTSFSLRW